jgi:hypothetical protein
MHTCIQIYTHTYTYINRRSYICIYLDMYTNMNIYISTCDSVLFMYVSMHDIYICYLHVIPFNQIYE